MGPLDIGCDRAFRAQQRSRRGRNKSVLGIPTGIKAVPDLDRLLWNLGRSYIKAKFGNRRRSGEGGCAD